RLAQGLAQESLAGRAGISVGTLRNLESGRSVQLSSLLRVLRVVGNFTAINDLVPQATPGPLLQLEMSRLAAKGTRKRAPRRTGGGER
ncbi:MAG TPA: helix-turn-helix transcriptional regulator, partial [Mycobacterium sp.]